MRHRHSLFQALGLFAAALLLSTSGCSRESAQKDAVRTTTEGGSSTAPAASGAAERDRALVRAVHALPAAKNLDVFADETKVFSNVGYKDVTPYLEIRDDRFTFRIRPAGQDGSQALAENSEGVGDGRHYTVVSMPGQDQNAALYVFSDNLTPPSEGKAKVRIIHAARGIEEIDVHLSGRQDPLFTGVNFQSETMYEEIAPAAGTLEVRSSDRKTRLLRVPNTRFDAGKIYTIVVVGRSQGSPRLEAIQIQDEFVPGSGQRAAGN